MITGISRFFRAAFRHLLRHAWHILGRQGIEIAPAAMLTGPVDAHVGRQAFSRRLSKVLTICDLTVVPLSYDVTYFMQVADLFRQHVGADAMDLAIYAHRTDPFLPAYPTHHPVNAENHRHYVHNFCFGAARVFPSIDGIYYFTDRPEFVRFVGAAKKRLAVFPERYDPLSPDYEVGSTRTPLYGLRQFRSIAGDLEHPFTLHPPAESLAQARRWIALHAEGRPLITITLRELPYLPERNSTYADWQAMCDAPALHGFSFALLRDYWSLHTPSPIHGPRVFDCSAAVHDLPFRAAMYELAHLNLFVGNGPLALSLFNPKSRHLAFKVLTGAKASNATEWKELHGIDVGDQVPGATPFQRLVWKNDTADVLIAEVAEMLSTIDRHSQVPMNR